MSASLPYPTTGFHSEAIAFGSRMEAATEALLRIRNEVVTTLDRQVVELRQIHHALAYTPPPMVESFEPSIKQAPQAPSVGRPSVFELPPGFSARGHEVALASRAGATPMDFAAPNNFGYLTEAEKDYPAAEGVLDPVLERATLEELNDALASAFAMVSSRPAH